MKKIQNIPFKVAGVALLAFFIATGCQSYRGDVYSRDEARSGNAVLNATVMAVKDVTIEGTEGALGGIGGAVLGGLTGRAVGGGSGKNIATAAGAIGGALAGAAIESAVTTKSAIEITVQYENGAIEAIVQEPGRDLFQVGQAVQVLISPNGTKRVRP
ncbi:MAG: glycine zipper 2TM domain-containing protein [Lentisphaerae bacterium]|jgi:outer membrane lipoprotein SlyB|nr:glycine zipper 2TM domain-containing protein [Lentisphaerota bacterium]